MKFIYGVLFMCMVYFAAVQYNDPDGLFWAALYSIPALAMLVGMIKPAWLQSGAGKVVLFALILVLAVGVWSFWPDQPGFWRKAVWWETETAREGLGVMIAFLVTCSALLVALGKPVRDVSHG